MDPSLLDSASQMAYLLHGMVVVAAVDDGLLCLCLGGDNSPGRYEVAVADNGMIDSSLSRRRQ